MALAALCGVGGRGVSQAAPAAGDRPPFTLRSTSRLVYVAVMVRDANGAPVHGLKKENFKVMEDGRTQRVDLFEPVTSTVGGAAGGVAGAGSQAKRDGFEFSNAPDSTSRQAVNMVLFDLLDTAATDQLYARKQMLRFLTELPPGHRVALFVLSDRLHMLQSFTGSSELLAQAAKLLDPKEMYSVRNAGTKIRENDEITYATQEAGPASRGLVSPLGIALARELTREDALHVQRSLAATAGAFQDLARAASGYTGRKNLFWLAGYFPPASVSSLRSLGSNLDPTLMNFAGQGESASANRAIADSQIAVYPISVLGVETDSIGAEQSGIGSAGGSMGGTSFQQFSDRQDTRSNMNGIAHDTGGEAMFGTNDLTGALRRSLEDGENYYELAYQPDNERWDGRYRHIDIKIGGQGYKLDFRRGYFALKEQPLARDAGGLLNASLLPGTPGATMLLVRSNVVQTAAKKGLVQVNSNVGLGGLSFKPGPEGRRQGQVLVSLVANEKQPANGKLTAAVPVPKENTSLLNLDLTNEQYEAMMKTGLAFSMKIALDSGPHTLRLGVMDVSSQRLGVLDLPVEVNK